jgi:hypothetical protein
MTFRSKFDVDLTRIVKEESVEYLSPSGNTYSDFEDAVRDVTASTIKKYLRGSFCEYAIRDILNTGPEERQLLRDVLDYLDRD